MWGKNFTFLYKYIKILILILKFIAWYLFVLLIKKNLFP